MGRHWIERQGPLLAGDGQAPIALGLLWGVANLVVRADDEREGRIGFASSNAFRPFLDPSRAGRESCILVTSAFSPSRIRARWSKAFVLGSYAMKNGCRFAHSA